MSFSLITACPLQSWHQISRTNFLFCSSVLLANLHFGGPICFLLSTLVFLMLFMVAMNMHNVLIVFEDSLV